MRFDDDDGGFSERTGQAGEVICMPVDPRQARAAGLVDESGQPPRGR